jgi:hypothetical protein
MHLIDIERSGEDDLQFVFLCQECALTKRMRLFELLAKGAFSVYHADNEDGFTSLIIRLETEDANLPQVFRDFFDSLDS